MSDPNMHWDGQQWLRWDGEQWVPDQSPPPQVPHKSHAGVIIGAIAAVVVMALLLTAGGFWLIRSRMEDDHVHHDGAHQRHTGLVHRSGGHR